MSNTSKSGTKIETIDRLQQRINKLDLHFTKRARQYNFMIATAELQAKFNESDEVNYYSWTYQRIFKNQTCFVSGDLILFGSKAYKGTRKVKCIPKFYATLYPEEIWLSIEEFTMRRLKGQI